MTGELDSDTKEAIGWYLAGIADATYDPTTNSLSNFADNILQDSGADNADGGDRYQLPQAADSIDLQNSGEIENAEAISTGAATIDGKEGMGMPNTSTSGDLSFGDWETVAANRPAMVKVRGKAETDGNSFGQIKIEVDESGGTSADYVFYSAVAAPSLGSGAKIYDNTMIPLVPGAAYRIINDSDPNNANGFSLERIFEQ